MKYFILALLLFALQAKSQIPFKTKYKDCNLSDTCFYCGDTPARYKKDIRDKIQRSLDHGTAKW
jgi:hypothetical protein